MMVSVVMPVYNGEAFLHEAIDSILCQNYCDYEFIIIDDGSNDGTEQIIRSYTDKRIIYLRNDVNLGVALSLNRGIDQSKGKYIARMDADDKARPERLGIQVEYMECHPKIDVLATSSKSFNRSGVLFEGHTSTDEEVLKLDNLFSCGLCHPTVMMRKETLDRLHLRYDDTFDKVEDYELWSRMISLGCMIKSIDIILLDHRLHENQVTTVYSHDMIEKLDRIHKRTLDSIGIDYTTEELASLCAYGTLGRTDRIVNYKVLCGLLQKILHSGKYDPVRMKKYCKGFAYQVLKDKTISITDKARFAIQSEFLSFFDLARCFIK
ncbi:MAG: glycosyltransferase family 2 protein [Oscillospiraceae bacterium]|nr:glycosyltransferase family 2 protein [Oscillospiraceae bacterium]